MYIRIQKDTVVFPDPKKHSIDMSDECKDFIRGLLDKNPKTRLGSTYDINELLEHPWLKSINTNDIFRKKV